MACTSRQNRELQQKCDNLLKKGGLSAIEELRCIMLKRNGATGIKDIGRKFRLMDDDHNRQLTRDEFKNGLLSLGLSVDNLDLDGIFNQLDRDKSGTLDFEEFLKALRPPMSEQRKELIYKAFNVLDKSGDGIITVEDLKGVYNVTKHKKYLSGEWSEEQCLEEFLSSFDTPNEADGKVTREEFMNYYAGVSASIDSDAYFNLMMTNAWNLNKPRKGTAFKM